MIATDSPLRAGQSRPLGTERRKDITTEARRRHFDGAVEGKGLPDYNSLDKDAIVYCCRGFHFLKDC